MLEIMINYCRFSHPHLNLVLFVFIWVSIVALESYPNNLILPKKFKLSGVTAKQ